MNFPFQRGAEVKNQSIISTSKRDDRHKKKNTSLYNQYIPHIVQNLKLWLVHHSSYFSQHIERMTTDSIYSVINCVEIVASRNKWRTEHLNNTLTNCQSIVIESNKDKILTKEKSYRLKMVQSPCKNHRPQVNYILYDSQK
jgi:hypothetical protein